MQKLLLAGCALALLAGSATAGSRHDLKLEQAVMDIVAGKIGEIRGGLSAKQDAVAANDQMSTASTGLRFGDADVSGLWGHDGLAPARERPRFVPD